MSYSTNRGWNNTKILIERRGMILFEPMALFRLRKYEEVSFTSNWELSLTYKRGIHLPF
jgi:hypothetical protein